MTMKSSTRQLNGVTVVDLSGRITLGEGSVLLRDSIRDLIKAIKNENAKLPVVK